MIKNLEEWRTTMQGISLATNSPIKQKNGLWEFSKRRETFKALAPRIFDDQLKSLRTVAVEVLRARDPSLELESDARFVASFHGKTPKYSPSLKKGLAETLAFLAITPKDEFVSLLYGAAEITAVTAIRDILEGADWILWASLKDYLPTLAEAAPDQFLSAVESSLSAKPCPFAHLFEQEVSGVMGQNYMTGLLWALELLAWAPEYLQRAVLILGELDALDPGGNWGNRPGNSLVEIFLPWFPQTSAPIAKRITAVKSLVREQPAAGWKLLMNLMPNATRSSSGTFKPKWRSFIPENWADKVTNGEYSEQIKGYGEIAIAEARKDFSKLSQLIEPLPYLPNPVFSEILRYIESDAVVSQPETVRLPLWEALVNLVSRHRKFRDNPKEKSAAVLDEIEAASTKLAPQSLLLLYRRLFDWRDYELFEESDDIEGQLTLLSTKRQSAVLAILKEGGLESLLNFATKVKNSWLVGNAFGKTDWENSDSLILPAFLGDEDTSIRQFVSGFVLGKLQINGWEWVARTIQHFWTTNQKTVFFTMLPFHDEAWQRVEKVLGKDAAQYWKTVPVAPMGKEQPHLIEAIEKLLENGRPRSTLFSLGRLIHNKQEFPPAVAVKALLNSVTNPEQSNQIDTYSVIEIIKWLQENSNTDKHDLFKVEWAYLSLLDRYHSAEPKTLEMSLASDPAFFSEIISTVFKSDKETDGEHPKTEDQKLLAKNAYHLLHGWRTVPGTNSEGKFDETDFIAWLKKAEELTEKSGRFKIAQDQIGKVLAHTPADPNGLWIHHIAAEALNGKDATEMRIAFRCQLFNQRGVHGFSHGNEEKEIAQGFYQKAEELEDAGYTRIAATVRDLAKDYDLQAEIESKKSF